MVESDGSVEGKIGSFAGFIVEELVESLLNPPSRLAFGFDGIDERHGFLGVADFDGSQAIKGTSWADLLKF